MIKFNIQYFAQGTSSDAYEPANNAAEMTKTVDLTLGLQQYYNKDLLENARPELFFSQFSKKCPLPQGNGKKVQFRKWKTLDTTVTTFALQEGVTPKADKLQQTEVTGDITQYGNYVVVTDLLDMTHIDDAVLGASEELGAQAGQILDKATRNVLMTSTNVSTPGGKAISALGTGDIITPDDVNKIATRLKKNLAPKIDGKYIAIIHPSVAYDLRANQDWIDVHKYAATTEIFNGEIGELHGVRFIETTQVAIFKPGSTNLYGCFFFGKDAFGEVDLSGGALEMIVKPLGSGGSSDPLNQRQTVGFKASHGAVILYPERLVKYVCASSFSGTDVADYTETVPDDDGDDTK